MAHLSCGWFINRWGFAMVRRSIRSLARLCMVAALVVLVLTMGSMVAAIDGALPASGATVQPRADVSSGYRPGAADGGAHYAGSMGGTALNKPIVGMSRGGATSLTPGSMVVTY
jgi:hypothetical protein